MASDLNLNNLFPWTALRSVRGRPVLRWIGSSWTGIHSDLKSQRRWIPRTGLRTRGQRLVRGRLVPRGNGSLTAGGSQTLRARYSSTVGGSQALRASLSLTGLHGRRTFLAGGGSPMAWSSPVPKGTDSIWTPHFGTSPAVVRFWEEPTPAGLLSTVVRLHVEPTPAGPSSAVVWFWEEPTLAGRSARDSAELWLCKEPESAALPLLLRELYDRLWECFSWWESSWPLSLLRFQSSSPLSSSLLKFLAGAGDASWSVSHGTAILLDGTPVNRLELTSRFFHLQFLCFHVFWIFGANCQGVFQRDGHCILSSFFCLLFPFHCRLRSYRLHSMSDQFMQYW